MLATELLFVDIYCRAADAIKAGALSIPREPLVSGPLALFGRKRRR